MVGIDAEHADDFLAAARWFVGATPVLPSDAHRDAVLPAFLAWREGLYRGQPDPTPLAGLLGKMDPDAQARWKSATELFVRVESSVIRAIFSDAQEIKESGRAFDVAAHGAGEIYLRVKWLTAYMGLARVDPQRPRHQPGRPRLACNEWAWAQVNVCDRPPQEVRAEWARRYDEETGGGLVDLQDPDRSFRAAIAPARKKI